MEIVPPERILEYWPEFVIV